MNINRRKFIASSAIGAAASCTALSLASPLASENHRDFSESFQQPAFGIIPVVSDGKWIWKDPPKKTGYHEPREFDVSVGMSFTGQGNGSNLRATTVAPVQFPEQEILDFRIEKQNCLAKIVPIVNSAAQLQMVAATLQAGQTAWAIAHYRLRIQKVFQGFAKEQFPNDQSRIKECPKRFLRSSPGIKIHSTAVKNVLKKTINSTMHPWDKARAFHGWVWENIQGIPGRYTSVEKAIKNRQGDCEERACTFIALCRAAGIPARQVWVPSHVWAEIGLHNHDGVWHWIPVHTAAYNWFGWTGAHEVVLQKGDHLRIQHRRKTVRLIDDWYQLQGPRPVTAFTTHLKPVAPTGTDAGPGARKKLKDGRWELTGNHPANKLMRDQ